jgi:AraC-like DNA-binding protein
VLRGSFAVRVGSREYELTPRALFVTSPGLVYRTLHAERRPKDVCLSIEYAPEFFAHTDFTPASPVVALTNRSAYLRWRIERALTDHAGDLAFEDLAAEILASAGVASSRKLFAERSLAWYAPRVERVREILESSFSEDHSLASLARAAGISAFHFARLFRELVGVPPGRYLLWRRLERAHALLRANRTVTDACYDCGFRSLSYFVRAFRKRYGARPSDIRPSRN